MKGKKVIRRVDEVQVRDSIRGRLREFIEWKSGTIYKFCRDHKFSYNVVRGYCVDGGTTIPGGLFFYTLKRRCTEVNLNWLFFGEGQMCRGLYDKKEEKRGPRKGVPYYY